jgi:hypothetical protein
MEQGWDPEVKNYFRKILNTISFGLIWMMTMAALGLYFGFAYTNGKSIIIPILFYSFMAITLFFLIRFLYKTWNK